MGLKTSKIYTYFRLLTVALLCISVYGSLVGFGFTSKFDTILVIVSLYSLLITSSFSPSILSPTVMCTISFYSATLPALLGIAIGFDNNYSIIRAEELYLWKLLFCYTVLYVLFSIGCDRYYNNKAPRRQKIFSNIPALLSINVYTLGAIFIFITLARFYSQYGATISFQNISQGYLSRSGSGALIILQDMTFFYIVASLNVAIHQRHYCPSLKCLKISAKRVLLISGIILSMLTSFSKALIPSYALYLSSCRLFFARFRFVYIFFAPIFIALFLGFHILRDPNGRFDLVNLAGYFNTLMLGLDCSRNCETPDFITVLLPVNKLLNAIGLDFLSSSSFFDVSAYLTSIYDPDAYLSGATQQWPLTTDLDLSFQNNLLMYLPFLGITSAPSILMYRRAVSSCSIVDITLYIPFFTGLFGQLRGSPFYWTFFYILPAVFAVNLFYSRASSLKVR